MGKKTQIIIAALLGFLAVALGAFGAHGLSNLLSEKMLETYKTGVLYHLIHSAILLAISLSAYKLTRAFIFITIGIIFFSFSLYIYSVTGMSLFAMITPLGGVSFLIGWILIAVDVYKQKVFK